MVSRASHEYCSRHLRPDKCPVAMEYAGEQRAKRTSLLIGNTCILTFTSPTPQSIAVIKLSCEFPFLFVFATLSRLKHLTWRFDPETEIRSSSFRKKGCHYRITPFWILSRLSARQRFYPSSRILYHLVSLHWSVTVPVWYCSVAWRQGKFSFFDFKNDDSLVKILSCQTDLLLP